MAIIPLGYQADKSECDYRRVIVPRTQIITVFHPKATKESQHVHPVLAVLEKQP